MWSEKNDWDQSDLGETEKFGPSWKTWPADTTVNTYEFSTKKGNPDTILLTLPTGFYRAECQSSDSFGKEVKAMLPLMVLPDTSEKIFGLKLPSLALVNNQTVEVGKNLEVRWGTGYGRGQCLVEVLHKNKVIRRYWTDTTVTQHSFTIPVQEKYRGGFLVHLTYVRENRAYQHEFRITVPWDNKQLSLSLETFRSALEPGEKQTISLRVKNDKYPLKDIELLASMYDQSLDQYFGHNWSSLNFFKTDNSRFSSSFSIGTNNFVQYNISRKYWNDSYSYPSITYTRFPSSVVDNLFYYQFNSKPSQFTNSYDATNKTTTRGKIAGVVMDAETKEPLPGVVVSILGTTMGANTDLDGRYSIGNLPVGTYSVQARMMGYESKTIKGIESKIGLTTTVNFKLKSTVVQMEGTVVRGERGTIQVRADITSTTKTVSTKEIENMAGVRSYQDVVAQQSGAIEVSAPSKQSSFDWSGVAVRQNLNETAFFLPHLYTDGTIKFEVTMPEALTKWRFMGFAHGKQLQNGFVSGTAVTQKALMVQPNAPRFLREGDTLLFSTKVINMTDSAMTGLVQLNFKDLATDQSRDTILGLLQPAQEFTLSAKSSQGFTWRISVPKGIGPLVFTVAAKSQGYSDGEEGTVPVLTSRLFLTESVPLWIN
ncbi:MAG: carboxypeptidase-like regulatory domain-containing protein, partial [Saprospiraceae bacterium]|nr:carboxypeptidase-like regulatory domain-containing protein [Saprospiraceae bacterium]